jgi:hypothetical protein
MRSKGHIDREKHEVDIAEHILRGGIRSFRGDASDRPLDLVEDDRAPSALGVVASTVEVQVLDADGVTEWIDRQKPAGDPKR